VVTAVEPTAQPTALTFSKVTSSSFFVAFTAPSTAPSGYLVLRKEGGTVTALPVDGNTYTPSTSIGDSEVVYSGNATSFDQTSLKMGVTYHYAVFAYNGSGSGTNYNPTNPLRGSQLVPIGSTVTDVDGNAYEMVAIGTQIWLKSNLKVSKYRNGEEIPNGADVSLWSSTNSGAWVYLSNLQSNNEKYGKLYNWYAVSDAKGICPNGWHVPSNNEWNDLIKFLDPEIVPTSEVQSKIAGGALKAVEGWKSNAGSTNITGFSALPGGSRYASGEFPATDASQGGWWSSTESDDKNAWLRFLGAANNYINIYSNPKSFGFSIRCLADVNVTAPTGLTLSSASINEGLSSGTTVGTFSTTDAEGGTFSYSLVAGEGSTNNASFTIEGAALKSAVVFDFESKSSYTIRVRTTDNGGLFFEKSFVISINDLSEAPTNLSLSVTSITEGLAIGTTVGTFTSTNVAGGSFSFTLVSGEGATDNASFTIEGGTLKSAAVFNSATKAFYSIRVRVTEAGGLFFEKSFTILVVAAEPTAQPTALKFTGVTSGALSVGFTAATPAPAGYLILRKQGSAMTALPVDGSAYSATTQIGDATVVYAGNATGTNETQLEAGKQYFYRVFSYNGVGQTINYNTTTPLEGNRYTIFNEPTAQPTAIQFSEITVNSFKLSFTAAGGNPSGYLIIRKSGAQPQTDPTDGTTYAVGDAIGDGQVAYLGTALTLSETNLKDGTTYHYKIYSYNGQGDGINYLQSTALSGSQSTLALEPSGQPSGLTFSSITTSSFTVGYSAPSTPPGAYLVLRKKGSAVTAVPVDGTAYQVSTTLGDATVVYNGTGTSFGQNDLEKEQTYHYAVFAYNGSGGSVNYNIKSPLSGSQLVPLDVTAPVFSSNTTPEAVEVNKEISVSLKVSDGETKVNSV